MNTWSGKEKVYRGGDRPSGKGTIGANEKVQKFLEAHGSNNNNPEAHLQNLQRLELNYEMLAELDE